MNKESHQHWGKKNNKQKALGRGFVVGAEFVSLPLEAFIKHI